ncbi:unnamed protein product [Caenorhabditis auriculariae]|uniref:W02B3.4-like N-terminal domain-containing protein n=1 Tax=Caenorhabditis auriculariae TaxID=2777116 RepID=A0A8S1GWQ8_9PELO|nr:unnamed protein product [Caenorhabditis auriculariae]
MEWSWSADSANVNCVIYEITRKQDFDSSILKPRRAAGNGVHERNPKIEKKVAFFYLLWLVAFGYIAFYNFYQSKPFEYSHDSFIIKKNEIITETCLKMLAGYEISAPALLIDIDILKQIAVLLNYSVHPAIVGNPNFNVILYENIPENDYWAFKTDPARIVQKMQTTSIGNLEVPNSETFLEYWSRSKFISCLDLNMNRTDNDVTMDPKAAVYYLARLRDLLVKYKMYPFLNGGSLLGWYRECGVIPHTRDMDLMVLEKDVKEDIVVEFLERRTEFHLMRMFGDLNDTFELTVRPKGLPKPVIDIFTMYTEENGTWTGGTASDGTKYKYTFPPYDPYCSASLFGHIFWVTCSPDRMLEVNMKCFSVRSFKRAKTRKLFVCFLLAILAGLLFLKLLTKYVPISLRNKTNEDDCQVILTDLKITVPALLIDTDLLRGIASGRCSIPDRKINIAVENKDIRKAAKLFLDPIFNVTTFLNKTTRDYWIFVTDPLRITRKIETTSVGLLKIPRSSIFLEYWRRSEFIPCLHTAMNRTDDSVYLDPKTAIGELARLRDQLVDYRMYPFLNGGTLLGWYRECTVIPHTLDLDLMVMEKDVKPAFIESLKNGQTDFYLIRTLGEYNDTFEITLRPNYSQKPHIDIFTMYTEMNGTWTGGTDDDGTKYKYTFPPYDPYCSASLFGHIFWVTCSPERMLEVEYGKNWRKDYPTSEFDWSASQKNVKQNGRWNKSDISRVIQYFER